MAGTSSMRDGGHAAQGRSPPRRRGNATSQNVGPSPGTACAGLRNQSSSGRAMPPSRSWTKATTSSPYFLSGRPTTAAASTSGCRSRTSSTSRGYTLYPPRMIRSLSPRRGGPPQAEPQPDVVRGARPGPDVRGLVIGAVVAERLPGPGGADDVDGLAERHARLRGRAARASQAGDRLGEGAGAEAELEPAAAEHVDRGRLPGEHGRWAQRQGGHLGEEGEPAGPAPPPRAPRPA